MWTCERLMCDKNGNPPLSVCDGCLRGFMSDERGEMLCRMYDVYEEYVRKSRNHDGVDREDVDRMKELFGGDMDKMSEVGKRYHGYIVNESDSDCNRFVYYLLMMDDIMYEMLKVSMLSEVE